MTDPGQRASWMRGKPPEAIVRDALTMAARMAREGCAPCVDAYLDLARRNGAAEDEIAAAMSVAAPGES